MALEEASKRPIFSSGAARVVDPSILYPNVFDILTKAQLTSSFIGGCKVHSIYIIINNY